MSQPSHSASSNMHWAERAFGKRSELVLVAVTIGILLVLFTPIPAGLLDFLLITNFSFALLVLLLTFYMDKPLGFSTFPSLLLIATLFRLSLNIAATRLILSDADAGAVISAVGHYIVGGNYVIGLVVFLILIVVQYVVVTNGAQRVAEVAARFTLDSMPGKQMSIDADMNMGLIDEKQARKRRKHVEKEANFYGAMDGASKFVKGDAIAGILIVLIDIIGGLAIGIAQKGMPWSDAVYTYTLLTVGDGIVTQIPALIISTATGIIVTRAATDAQFGMEITRQITRYPKTLVMLSVALLGLLFLPSIPAFPVIIVLAIALSLAYVAFKHHNEEVDDDDYDEGIHADDERDEKLYKTLQVDPLTLHVGTNLLSLTTEDENDSIIERINRLREQLAEELGFVVPSTKIIIKDSLDPNRYEIHIFDSKIATGTLHREKLLAISATDKSSTLEGISTTDPSYGLPALWIDSTHKDSAIEQGFTVVDSDTVLLTHCSEIIRRHTPELLTRNETEKLIYRVKQAQPALYEDVIPNTISLAELQSILQLLLEERVSIRNMPLIFEALLGASKTTKEIGPLTDYVRKRLGRSICDKLVNDNGELHVMTLSAHVEQALLSALRQEGEQATLLLDTKYNESFMNALGQRIEAQIALGVKPTLVTMPSLRRPLRQLLERVFPQLNIIALTEIPKQLSIQASGTVSVDTSPRQPLGGTPS